MSPADIAQLVSQLPRSEDPNVIIGYETADDAGVYRLDEDRALVQTLDFFPPVLDDPYDYGRVVAANSLSDVYAMGGRALSALVIALVPPGPEWLEVLKEVMRGIGVVAKEDSVALLGGHTMYSSELVMGLSVTGVIDPELVTSNAAAKPGDVLVLTKPLGSGILSTALKNKVLTAEEIRPLTESMCTSNRLAAEAAGRHGAHSVTDVTGFGLLGHLNWMMKESGTTGVVRYGDVLFFAGTKENIAHLPGGSRRNLAHVESVLAIDPGVEENAKLLLADAQTSGGLVVALPPERVEAFLADLPAGQRSGASVIGEVRDREDGFTIRIAP
jgi:selenide,water dikinase